MCRMIVVQSSLSCTLLQHNMLEHPICSMMTYDIKPDCLPAGYPVSLCCSASSEIGGTGTAGYKLGLGCAGAYC